MLLQICCIIIEFYLSIAYHAYCFVLGSCQKYLHHDKLSMNDRLSDVTSESDDLKSTSDDLLNHVHDLLICSLDFLNRADFFSIFLYE